jgi:hypothetical protein
MKKISIAVALGLALLAAGTAAARADTDPPKAWQDVRALVVRFNDAQNAHNLDVASQLLLNSPDLEWTEGGLTLRGHDAAVNRLAQLYSGIFAVLPDYGQMTISLVGPDEAKVSMPVTYGFGQPGTAPNTTQSILSARAVKTAVGWRLAQVEHEPAPIAQF